MIAHESNCYSPLIIMATQVTMYNSEVAWQGTSGIEYNNRKQPSNLQCKLSSLNTSAFTGIPSKKIRNRSISALLLSVK